MVCGLRPSSRLMLKLSNAKAPVSEVLQAMLLDTANLLLWSKTKDAAHGRNKPEPIASRFFEENQHKEGFANGEEFEKALRKIKERATNGR